MGLTKPPHIPPNNPTGRYADSPSTLSSSSVFPNVAAAMPRNPPLFSEAEQEQKNLFEDPRRFCLLQNPKDNRDEAAASGRVESHLSRTGDLAQHIFDNGRYARPYTGECCSTSLEDCDYYLLSEDQHLDFVRKGLLSKPIVLRDPAFTKRRNVLSRSWRTCDGKRIDERDCEDKKECNDGRHCDDKKDYNDEKATKRRRDWKLPFRERSCLPGLDLSISHPAKLNNSQHRDYVRKNAYYIKNASIPVWLPPVDRFFKSY
jgi:hypothetical protein